MAARQKSTIRPVKKFSNQSISALTEFLLSRNGLRRPCYDGKKGDLATAPPGAATRTMLV
jgi:hypothetical protein